MALCESHSFSRSSSRLKRHRHKGSCWRNPFLVFFLSFVTIGSLRFRVPERSKKVAVSLVKRKRDRQERLRNALKEKRNHLMIQHIEPSNDVGGTELSAHIPTKSIRYVMMEDVSNTEGGSALSYRKFKAVLSSPEESGNDMNEHGITVKEWASTVAMASEDDTSIALLNNIIASTPYAAVFFETPSTTALTYESQIFEFALIDAPQLHAMAQSPMMNANNPFQSTLATAPNATSYAATFPNLGADAILIVPKAMTGSEEQLGQYSHLANFIRNGPSQQIASVWNMVAQAYLDRILQLQHNPVWLSTSGMGVLWLHFRLDTIPKYYAYEPYKQFKR